MAFRNIAVSGRIACGSTTLGRALADQLHWQLREGGQIFRDIMKREGFDLEKHPEKRSDDIDVLVDKETRLLLLSPASSVVNADLAGFLSRDIPHTLRVLLVCPFDIQAKRYMERGGYGLDEAKRLLVLRERVDQERFERLYGSNDFFGPSLFHLVLDSGALSIDGEISEVMKALAANSVN